MSTETVENACGEFFRTWAFTDEAERLKIIKGAVTADVEYTDPRTPDTLRGASALSEYVRVFSANAPGWSAKVLRTDSMAAVMRVAVAFRGPGPDGIEMTQYGQYFVEKEGAKISRMVGFVGTGAPPPDACPPPPDKCT